MERDWGKLVELVRGLIFRCPSADRVASYHKFCDEEMKVCILVRPLAQTDDILGELLLKAVEEVGELVYEDRERKLWYLGEREGLEEYAFLMKYYDDENDVVLDFLYHVVVVRPE